MKENLKARIIEIIKKIITVIFSLIIIFGSISEFNILDNRIMYNGNNYVYVVAFFMIYYILKDMITIKNKRLNIISILCATIISTIYIVSYITSKYLLNNIHLESKMYLFFIITKFLATLLVCYFVIKKIYEKVEDKIKVKNYKEFTWFSGNVKSLIIVTIIIFIGYVPYIIDSFPGNLTYDFAIQIRQALNYEPIVNHHPFINTKLIGICLKIGKSISSFIIGIFLYTLMQCLLSSFAFSSIIYYMARKNISVKYRFLTLMFFIILPIFGFYSTWLTKDILFTVGITMVTLGIVEMSENLNIVNSKKYIIYMIITLLATMLFRKNGVYVSVILFLITIIVNRKNWFKVILIFLIPITLFKIIDGPVRKYMSIENGSTMEMYSIPAQQMGRLYKYNKNDLTNDEILNIEKYILDDNINEIYDPLLSDPVKAKLNEKEINDNKIEFIKFFVKLAVKYPKQTIESFTCTTYRFYYLNNEVERGLGQYKNQSIYVIDNMLPENMNVKSNLHSVKFIEKIDDIVTKNDVPIISTFLGSGIYVNIYIICIGYLIYSKKYRKILGFLPIWLVLMTQLAGPVVDQRYSYSLFTCFPLLVGITVLSEKKEEEK